MPNDSMTPAEQEIVAAVDQALKTEEPKVKAFPQGQRATLLEQFDQMERIQLGLKEQILRARAKLSSSYDHAVTERKIAYTRDLAALDRQLEADLRLLDADYRERVASLERMAEKL